MQLPAPNVTAYPGSRLPFLTRSAIDLATKGLHLPLQRRQLLRERLARLTFLLKRSSERLDQPVLCIGTLLVGNHRRLCSFRSRRHLLDPLHELLQTFCKCRYVVRLVSGKLLKRSHDLAHLLLYERRQRLSKRSECFLLLRESAAHLVYLAAVLLALPGKRALRFLLQGSELIQQMRAELFQIVLVLSLLFRKPVVTLLNLMRLVTYLLGQREALLSLQVQGVLQFFRQLTNPRCHLLKGSVGRSLVLARLLQHILHQLRQALVVFHDLQLLSRDACQIELAYFAGDRRRWINNRPNSGDIAHTDQAGAWGNADGFFFDREPSRGDPPARHRLTGSGDPGSIGQTDPGIFRAS